MGRVSTCWLAGSGKESNQLEGQLDQEENKLEGWVDQEEYQRERWLDQKENQVQE